MYFLVQHFYCNSDRFTVTNHTTAVYLIFKRYSKDKKNSLKIAQKCILDPLKDNYTDMCIEEPKKNHAMP